jgi:hypothetical protein
VPKPPEILIVEKYDVVKEDDKTYIDSIEEGTTVGDLVQKITSNLIFEIFKGEEQIMNVDEKLATGMVVRVQTSEGYRNFDLVVTGDINGDSEIDGIDLLMLARFQVGYAREVGMVQGAYLKAANVMKKDDEVDGIDILKLARCLVGLDTIFEKITSVFNFKIK